MSTGKSCVGLWVSCGGCLKGLEHIQNDAKTRLQLSEKSSCDTRSIPKSSFSSIGDDKATIPVTDTEFNQAVNPQSFCTGVSLHHPALIQNTGPLIDMSDIRPGTSKCTGNTYRFFFPTVGCGLPNAYRSCTNLDKTWCPLFSLSHWAKVPTLVTFLQKQVHPDTGYC